MTFVTRFWVSFHGLFSRKIEIRNVKPFFSGTEINCDTSFQEDFNPNNLTSSDIQLKKKGFLVDYFVRPPVTLNLTFEHPIWISYIRFNPKVGQQSTRGFQVLVNDSVQVSRHVIKDPNACQVTFQNYSFPGNSYQEGDTGKVRLGSTPDLKAVKSLTIKIFLTFKATPPCISDLQILGKLNDCVPESIRRDVNSIWKALTKAKFRQNSFQSLSLNPEASGSKRKSLDEDNCDTVPDEFIDTLTCKRMDIPMLLPCGEHVDRSSLDNYNEIESKWGRRPNDPFTGLVFTGESQHLPQFCSKKMKTLQFVTFFVCTIPS